MMLKQTGIFTTLILFFCLQTNAQSFGEKTFLGIMGSASQYRGALSNTYTKSGFSINLQYEITDKIHVRLQALATETGGEDKSLNNIANNGDDTRSATYYFHTNINEFSLMPEYNFININAGYKLSPYIFGGIGVYSFKPYQVVQRTRPNGTVRNDNLEMKQVEPFSNWQMSIPLGVGLKYAVSPNVLLQAEGNYRLLFNSYLDNYIADKKNDAFYTVSLGISFRLSGISVDARTKKAKNCKCPPVYY